MIDALCPPALLYVVFSLTHIIIDIFKQLYNTAFLKLLIMILFTLLLNLLCKRGLGIISWIIVFIPFITMTTITAIVLFIFNLSPSVGGMNYSSKDYITISNTANSNANPIANVNSNASNANSINNNYISNATNNIVNSDDNTLEVID